MAKGKMLFTGSLLLSLMCLLLPLTQAAGQEANCDCETVPPILTILSPTTGSSFNTSHATLTLSGQVSDANGIIYVWWANDRGGTGQAQGCTNWVEPWSWEATAVPLAEGDNLIMVTAMDSSGNLGTAVLSVSYSPQPPATLNAIDTRKAKFTFYFGGSDYDGLDAFSIVGYLKKDATEPFVMPFNSDVTVTVQVPNPDDATELIQIFTQTVSAGTTTGTTKYRYVTGPKGIRELTFQTGTATLVYMYVYVNNVDFMKAIKYTMTPQAYKSYVSRINRFIVTVQIGDKGWSAETALTAGTYSDHKQELVYNR